MNFNKWWSELSDQNKLTLVESVLDIVGVSVEEIDQNISREEIKKLYSYRTIIQ